MDFATVPEAPPTRKNQRETSCPPPISANVPYQRRSRFTCRAFAQVSRAFAFGSGVIAGNLSCRRPGVERQCALTASIHARLAPRRGRALHAPPFMNLDPALLQRLAAKV